VKPLRYFCAVLVLTGGTASASLIDEGPLTLSGTGLGAVPTILTVQSTGNAANEAGCVGWNGTADVTGTCTIGAGIDSTNTFAGGQEKSGASQTQTQLVSNATDLKGFSGPISYADLGLVMNIGQPGGGSIDLTSLILTVYDHGTATSFPLSCPAGGCSFTSSTSGLGKSDELFGISSDELTNPGTVSSTAHVGVAASFTGTQGAPESFFLAAIPPLSASSGGGAGTGGGPVTGGSQVPEPRAAVLMVAGLVILVFARRRHPL
jgi:hypothetical protein